LVILVHELFNASCVQGCVFLGDYLLARDSPLFDFDLRDYHFP
jgi:hypothetical protein